MNHITLTGRITKDAEVGEDNRPDRFRMAFERKKQDGYEPAFIEVSAWLNPDHVEEMLTKGTLVTVSGELDFFKTKDDNVVFTILAREVGPAAYARSKDGGGGRSNGRAAARNTGRSSSRSSRPVDDEDEPF